MDRLAAIRVFVAIADAGSLSAAARKLHMPLSTVSRQLTALEDELGTRSITRTTRQLALTESGRSLSPPPAASCSTSSTTPGAARLASKPSLAASLALTAPVVFGRLHVLPIVAQFLNSFPRVVARMLLVDRIVDLVEEGLDVGVRIGTLPELDVPRDARRRDPPDRLRQPVLSCRARRPGDAFARLRATNASASTPLARPSAGASPGRKRERSGHGQPET